MDDRPVTTDSNPDQQPEAEFVLDLARCEAQHGDPADLPARPELGTDQLLETARRHGLVPALARWQRAQNHESEPIKRANEQVVHRNLMLAGELRSLLNAFDDAGVQVMPHKGPVLAERLYDGVGHRQFTDLDLLVTSDDVGAGCEVLEQLGFESQYAFTPAQERGYRRTNYHHQYVHPDRGYRVEVHWRFVPAAVRFPLDVETYMDRSSETSVLNRQIPVPAPEDELLVLVVHGARHRWKRLKWLIDIARLVTTTEIDWQLVRRRATEWGCWRMLSLGLYLIRNLLGVTEAAGPNTWHLNTHPVRQLAATVESSVFDSTAEFPSEWQLTRFQARSRERRRDRLRTYMQSLFVPKASDFQALQLPDRLFLLYYPYRLYRLTKSVRQ